MPIVLTRATKLEARYKALGGSEHCSACRFYMPQGTCGRIIGPVSPEGWCKYYSREAVQRWSNPGYAGSGSGLPPGASLDLSFLTPGTLDPRITFTRASTATYTDSTGTIQTAAVNVPRWDYDPVTHALRGLLIEEARTNLMFPSTNWQPNTTASGSVDGVVRSVGTSPSGASDAMAFIPGSFSGFHQFYWSFAGITNTTYSSSVHAKAAGMNFVWLRLENTGFTSNEWATFNLSNGTVDTASGTGQATIRSVGNGWYRCTITGTSVASAGVYIANIVPQATGGFPGAATGNNVNGIWVWGAQVEQGAFPTSYIPTTAAAVTRAADLMVLPISTWFSATASSWVAMADALGGTPTNGRLIGDSISGMSPLLLTSTLSGPGMYDGSAAVTGSGVTPVNVVFKVGSAVTGGVGRVVMNGGAITSGAQANAAFSGFNIGSNNGTFDHHNGHIQRVTYWPRALSDAELQQVTT